MAYALIANTSGANTYPIDGTSATTSAINTTGASLIVAVAVLYSINSLGGQTFTDSNGNTWAALVAQTSANGNTRSVLYYCYAPTVGSGHTFTFSEAGHNIYCSLCVSAWSGAGSSPFDVENGSKTDSATSLATGSITPSAGKELIITGFGAAGVARSYTINGGFTITDSVTGAPGLEGSSLAYLIQTSATAANPTWSWTITDTSAVVIASFKASANVAVHGLPRLGVG